MDCNGNGILHSRDLVREETASLLSFRAVPFSIGLPSPLLALLLNLSRGAGATADAQAYNEGERRHGRHPNEDANIARRVTLCVFLCRCFPVEDANVELELAGGRVGG